VIFATLLALRFCLSVVATVLGGFVNAEMSELRGASSGALHD